MNPPPTSRAFRLALGPIGVAGVAVLAGCATPGPLHVYSIASATAPTISDAGPTPVTEVPDFLVPGETLTGFAYDPFTDHFFLRLAPGDRMRVVDRPAHAVKREFVIAHAPATGGGDLAVRPRDGHLFLTLPGEPALLEISRFGEFVRKIGLPLPAEGVAFDSAQNRLLVLTAGGIVVTLLDRADLALTTVVLSRKIAPGALGYDAERRELYAPLADARAVGVFGEDGKLRRSLPINAAFLDVGPRSFLRVF